MNVVTQAHRSSMTDPPIVVSAAGVTDVGRVRPHNEDAYVVEHGLYAVADGMGGAAAGEVASRMAIAALREVSAQGDLTTTDLAATLATANDQIRELADSHGSFAGMGTTACGVVLVRVGGAWHWAVFNVGDSRVYRVHAGQLELLTHDHSEVRELLDAGVITAEQAGSHPSRSVITRALGSEDTVRPDLWVRPPVPGERFVVCSDGLTNEVSDDEIMDIMRGRDDPVLAAETLARAALDAGGRDNVTVVVVAVDGDATDGGVTAVSDDTAPRGRPDRAPGAHA